ncbi:quinon protein alcohol dehydrogenase-like superfamily [Fimicolochytrium jonesii]|uniref:quinon protein alcohol dehydrogenase-like superfamily n=1 Tax=Fimicolochytrium jonesii TaxID=1396493 RepID=UPI0022FDB2B5|nr:quinon protein alcohol dehydrogenase-like superfamily [Fimicolochytrium jonesii]KAI8824379.1 quinon protein alcohol dehydrogenase-like superfamily [Fimicolochytrium jonesii]
MTISSSADFIGVACNRVSQATDCNLDGLVAFAAGRFVALYRPQDPARRGVKTTLVGHKDRVNCLRFLRRGTGAEQRDVGLVTGSADNTLRIWKQRDGDESWSCTAVLKGHTAGVSCLGVSRGRNIPGETDLVASAASDGTIRIWERRENGAEDTTECVQIINVGSRYPMALALGVLPGSDEPVLVTGRTDSKLSVYTRRDGNFVESLVLQGHSDWVRSLEIATYTASSGTNEQSKHFKDGDLIIASSSQDRYIRTWKISQTSLDAANPVADDFTSLMMSALAEAGLDEGDMQLSTKAHIMDLDTPAGKQKYAVMFDALLMAHDDWVHSAWWQLPTIKDGTYHQPMTLISASADKSIMIWRPDPATDTWVNQVRLGEIGGSTLGFYGALISPQGTTVIANGYNGALNVWSETSKDEWSPQVGISGHKAPVEDLQWDPSGQFIVSTSLDQTSRLLAPWRRGDLTTWHEIARPQIHGYDMHCLAFFHKYGFVSGADEKILRVFEAPRTFVRSLEQLTQERESDEVMEQRPLGASVPALGLSNKAVFEGDVAGAPNTHDFRNLSAYTAVASTSTSFTATMAQPPFEQHLLQHTLWPEINKLYGHGYEIVSVAASHNGAYVASACKAAKPEHASVRLWSTKTWKELCPPLAAHTLTVTGIRFSPDDRRILTVGRDRGWALFDINEDAGTFTLLENNTKAHSRIIWDGTWTHDGKYFATGSRDKTVKIWHGGEDERSWKCVETLKFPEAVTAIDFAPYFVHGRYVLAIGLEDGRVQIVQISINNGTLTQTDAQDLSDVHVSIVNAVKWQPMKSPADNSAKEVSLKLATCGDDCSVRIFAVTFTL